MQELRLKNKKHPSLATNLKTKAFLVLLLSDHAMTNHKHGYVQHSQNLPRRNSKRWKSRLFYWSRVGGTVAAVVSAIVSFIRLMMEVLR